MTLVNSSSPAIDLPAPPGSAAAKLPDGRGRESGRRTLSALAAVLVIALLCAVAAYAWRRTSLGRELSLARQALREFRPDEAAERLALLTVRCPDCAEAEFLLACACRRSRRLDEVEPHLKRALELGWDQADIDRQFSLTFFQAGDFRRAAPDIDSRLQQQATDDEAEETYEALARGYITAMLLPQANFMLDGWLEWRPTSAQAHLLRADVALLAGDEPLELACFREAVRCDPTHYEARQRLAQTLLHANEIEAAAELFASCRNDRPNDAAALVGLAECRERQGQWDEAKKLLEMAFQSHPNQRERAEALALAGQIALEDKDYTAASRFFQEAIDAHPSSLGTVYSLAQALSRAGRNDEAKIYHARFDRLAGLERKLEDLHEQLLHDPGNPDLRAEIGATLLEYGSSRAGVNWLLTALLYDPAHHGAHRRLAEFYQGEGETDLATRHRAAAEHGLQSILGAPVPLLPAAASAPEGSASGVAVKEGP